MRGLLDVESADVNLHVEHRRLARSHSVQDELLALDILRVGHLDAFVRHGRGFGRQAYGHCRANGDEGQNGVMRAQSSALRRESRSAEAVTQRRMPPAFSSSWRTN